MRRLKTAKSNAWSDNCSDRINTSETFILWNSCRDKNITSSSLHCGMWRASNPSIRRSICWRAAKLSNYIINYLWECLHNGISIMTINSLFHLISFLNEHLYFCVQTITSFFSFPREHGCFEAYMRSSQGEIVSHVVNRNNFISGKILDSMQYFQFTFLWAVLPVSWNPISLLS